MKSRMKKWARYRKAIISTPATKFPTRKPVVCVTSPEDNAAIRQTAVSKGAVSLAGIGGKNYRNTLYEEYQVRQRVYLILKIVLLIAVIAALTILYFHWVEG